MMDHIWEGKLWKDNRNEHPQKESNKWVIAALDWA